MARRIEVLAPAGDVECVNAALNAGADAVYFGLGLGFNARARAGNIAAPQLGEVLQRIHDRGRLGYLTLNTLVFDHEIPKVQDILGMAAAAGVDAVIVQDVGVARLVKALAPSLPLHASTQMTCTDEDSVRFAASLGAKRVTLARELSLNEVAQIAAASPIELEIFAHGALCIAYSGQCLTSEAIGGRSANRGACAQACRLPYELVIDGVAQPLGEQTYLLSPRDLETSTLVPEIAQTGVTAIKIEGRLKGPEYVAATTRLYRMAVDAAFDSSQARPTERDTERASQMFSRGASTGFLKGDDHQQLVDATHCDHVGIPVGVVHDVQWHGARQWLHVSTTGDIARGDGVVVQMLPGDTEEIGGRVWLLRDANQDVEGCNQPAELWLWLGPDRDIPENLSARSLFRTSSVELTREAESLAQTPSQAVALHAILRGEFGQVPHLEFKTTDGRQVEVALDTVLERARTAPTNEETIREKLARLGDTPFHLDSLVVELPANALVPMSALNRARRAAVQLLKEGAARRHLFNSEFALESLFDPEEPTPVAPGLFVTCRNVGQAMAAVQAGADGVYLDFLALTGLSAAVNELRAGGAPFVGVALPRITKPREGKIGDFISRLTPDALLLRSLGQLMRFTGPLRSSNRPLLIGDFSLNVTNTLSAGEMLRRGLDAWTPAFDLDAAQLSSILATPMARRAEVVVHHPMPLFHMQHCVIAARLSSGKDFRDCGRPCEKHQISLRDRKGLELPVEADIGCRNTVLHSQSQSALRLLTRLQGMRVPRFRVELLRESPELAQEIVAGYRGVFDQTLPPHALRERLGVLGAPVVEGSLRVIS